MLRKLGFPICGMIFLLLTLSGCDRGRTENMGKVPTTRISALLSKNQTDTERAYQTQQLYGPVTHNNTKLEYSQFLSNQFNAMNGVNTAIVMTTDQNAYVALMIDSSATGTKGYNQRNQ